MARELESLRQRYTNHRDTIAKLEADAPSEQLASRYAELRRELDASLLKVEDLALGRTTTTSTPRPSAPSTGTLPGYVPPTTATGTPLPASTANLTTPPGPPPREWQTRSVLTNATTAPLNIEDASGETDPTRRLIIIGAIALVVLALLGGLAYRYSKRNTTTKPVIVEQTKTTTTTPVVETATVAPVASSNLVVTPDAHDFGTIRKGTRAVRQFRIENHSDKAMTVAIKRAQCRCLWFDYDSKIAAHQTTILAVTVDGAKAKVGPLNEAVAVTAGDSQAQINIKAKIE